MKGKVEAGKAYVKGKVTAAKKRLGVDGKAVVKKVGDVAVAHAGKAEGPTQVRATATSAGREHLDGKGSVEVLGLPVLQRTTVSVKEKKADAPEAEEQDTRRSQATNPEVAGKILKLVQERMPTLLADFAKKPNSNRKSLDKLEASFVASFIKGRAPGPLTKKERTAALTVLGKARKLCRSYYNDFRDQAWKTLRKDEELKKLVKAKGSKAKWGRSAKSALKIEVRVTDAEGRKLKPSYRSIDFEHLTA